MVWGCLHELDVESGSQRTWELTSDEVSVGRMTQTKADDKLTIKWPKAYISGHHFSIKRSTDGVGYEIYDNSSNGTFKNGELIGKGNSCVLQSGDTIQLRFKQVDKIILTFSLSTIDSNAIAKNINAEPSVSFSSKRKRVETEEPDHTSRADHEVKGGHNRDSNLTSIKISALEQDSKQQEARIEAYITKLETSARENSNLLRELKAAQDDAREKESLLEELKQQCSVQEAHVITMEARAHKLEENFLSQKAIGEKLRSQLAISEEKESQVTELLLKVETLSDELKHRKSQNESRSVLCNELSLSLDSVKKQKESAEVELDHCKYALEQSRTETLGFKRNNYTLEMELRNVKGGLNDSLAKNALLEAMARQIKDEEDGNRAVFRNQISTICGSIEQLQADVTTFNTSYPPQNPHATIEACFRAMEQLQHSNTVDHPEQHQQHQEELEAPSCTQVHSPDRMKKTVSGESTIAFSRNSVENLEFTQMVGATIDSTDLPKTGYTFNTDHRQCSMYDTIIMTEEEGVDLGKIEDG